MEPSPPAARPRTLTKVTGSSRPDVLSGEPVADPALPARSGRAREELLDAALTRFTASGYDATTVEEIARNAGMAVGGFYAHFRSKRQILLVLVDRWLLELDSVPVPRGDDPASIMECIRWCFNSRWQHAGVYRAWREAVLRGLDARRDSGAHRSVDGGARRCGARCRRCRARRAARRRRPCVVLHVEPYLLTLARSARARSWRPVGHDRGGRATRDLRRSQPSRRRCRPRRYS